MLLLPHHHEFAETLANLPLFFKSEADKSCEVMHVLQKNPNYVPEMVNNSVLEEYLFGGEANQFVEDVDGYADNLTENDNLLLSPWELGDEWLGSV